MSRMRIVFVLVVASITCISSPGRADEFSRFLHDGPDGSYFVDQTRSGNADIVSYSETSRGQVNWQHTISGSFYSNTSYFLDGERIVSNAKHSPFDGVELHETWGDGTHLWFMSNEVSISDGAKWEPIHASVMTNSEINGMTVHCWSGDSEIPVWSADISDCLSGGALICVSDHGEVVAVAVNIADFCRILCYDAATGNQLSSFDSGSGEYYRSMEISGNGAIVALRVGRPIYVIQSATGNLRWEGNGGANSAPLGLSGDGNLVAAGFSSLLVWEWTGFTYLEKMTVSGGGRILRQCTFSENGNTLAVGWYPTSYDGNVIQCFNPQTSTLLWTYDYIQSSGEYQDIPVDIAVTDQGDFFVIGSWGSQFNTNHEIHVFSRDNSTPVFTVDAPGSIYSVDICNQSSGGFLVTACGKHVHANEMGNGGDLFSIQYEETSSIDGTLPAVGLSLSAFPNPFNPMVTLACTLPKAGPLSLSIFSPDGRLVRRLDGGSREAGVHFMSWDGRTDDGGSAASGVYLVELRTQRGLAAQQRVVLVR